MNCVVVNMNLLPPGAQKENLSDAEIITMFNNNDLRAWEQLYDKYAAVMFAAILRLTDDIPLAEKILVQSFSTLNLKDNFPSAGKILCVFLLHHTHATATAFLASRFIAVKKRPVFNKKFPLIDTFLYQLHSVKEATRLHSLSENELRLKLRAELIAYRNYKSQNKYYPKTNFN